MSERQYFVYIITNTRNTTFYIGVTNDLMRRLHEHREGHREGFSKKYNLVKLVYFEETDDISAAISWEKQLKNWHREWKINLIRSQNPDFEDLAKDWF